MAAARLEVVGQRLGHGEEAVEHEAGALDESEERPAHELRASAAAACTGCCPHVARR
jgi:hypothetical protein